MLKKYTTIALAACLCLSLIACANMQTKQEKGTLYGAGAGAATGAIVGQAIGKDTKSTLIGAGIGALVGGLAGNQIGKYMDMQEQELRQAIATSEAASIRRKKTSCGRRSKARPISISTKANSNLLPMPS